MFKERVFSEEVENAKIISITKPGKETSMEASKFRPISLINVGEKVLEKSLTNRITHRVYSNDLMNRNQFGFIPKRSATDAALAFKEYLEEGTKYEHIAILVSLDVKGAFYPAWWPSRLNTLKEFNCPENLYELAKSYFSERMAKMSTNTIQMSV
jgi:hypothetical protein